MKLHKRKYLLIIFALIIVLLSVLFVFILPSKTKTSVVTGAYNNSALDGCDGFRLKNGDTVDTFCFWTKPEDQTDYNGEIKVGDQVEYGTIAGKKFIRLSK